MMNDLERRLEDWHRSRYGKGVDVLRTMAKAQEELGELAKAVLKDDSDNALEECADVVFCLVHLARGLGGNLQSALRKKLSKIERRSVKRNSDRGR